MTVKKYYLKKGETEYALHSFEFTKEGNQAIDTTELSLSRTNDSALDIGDDISIGYHDGGDSFVAEFNGDVTAKSVNEELNLTMESYGGRMNRSDIIAEVHEDKSPEYIVEDSVDNYTTLTYAGTATTGVVIERFVIPDETAGEAINRIIKDLDWQIRVNNSKEVFLEPKGDQVSSVALIVGTNAFMESDWSKNPNRLINKCTVIGDKAKFNTNQTFAADPAQTTFEVDNKITGNVRVTVDGTEATGGQEGATETYDYTFKAETKEIVFASGMTGGESVIIYYEYEIPIKITAPNEPSIAAYGTFPKKITDNTLKTTSDARLLAKKIVSVYGNPITSGELLVNWTENIDVGETVQIVDSFNNIDQEFVIVGLTMNYPEGTKKIKVGVEEINILNWNKSLSERVKNLEAKQDNADVVQKYLPFIENLNVKLRQGRVRIRTIYLAHSFTLDHDTNGILDTALGIDGQQILLDEGGRTETVQSVENPNNISIERFNFVTYEDTNGTADWDTTNNWIELANSEAGLSKSIYLGGNTIVSATITMESEDDVTDLLIQLTADGTNWETVTHDTLHTFTDDGGDLRWRLINTSGGTITVTKVTVAYNF